MTERKQNKLFILGTALAVVCGIVWIFTNHSYDSEYQLTMGYRMVLGDRMLTKMWEPHQTSAFLIAFFELLFIKLTGSTTGIVIFLQSVGILIRACIALAIYFLFKRELDKTVSYMMALLFFMLLPKDLAIMEFSNLQLWCGVLAFAFLVLSLKSGKALYVILTAVFVCCQVLAYPSCIIVAIPVVVLYLVYGHRKQWLIFLGVCLGIGVAFAGYFIFRIGIDTIAINVKHALSLEPSHTGSALSKLGSYIVDFAKLIGYLVLSGTIAMGVEYVRCLRKNETSFNKSMWFSEWFITLSAFFLVNIFSKEDRYFYAVLLLLIIVIGFLCRKSLIKEWKVIYVCGMSIGLTSLVATLILSDLPFRVSMPYGAVAVFVSLVSIYGKAKEDKESVQRGFFISYIIFIALLALRCAYIRTPIYGRSNIMSTFDGVSLVRKGPAKGLITDIEGVRRQNRSYDDFNEYVSEDDTLWIIAGDVVDTMGYLYTGAKIATPTVMSTPTYNDEILYYFEENPEKYPTVVALASYEGELDWTVRADEWIMNWVENEFCPIRIEQGEYWTFYYR